MAEGHPLVGRTLEGRFRLTGFIGEGAMASVLRAADLQNGGVEVAVKVMHPHLAEDRTFAGRFKREAKAAAMLQHPNSVKIIHFGEDDRIHFIVMELVRGKDLREVLRVEKRLAEVRACRLVAGVCEALDAAHKLGIIHRDLKPENVMVVPDPQVPIREHVKVLDFGIAKLVDSSPKPRSSESGPDSDPPPQLTQVGVVVGTPAYMSPEQCRGQPLDGRSDIYTCGILLYQLVAGRVPFESESPFETAGKQAFEAPPPPSQFWPSIYPPLEALILKTLAKAAVDRPQSALELREALLAIISDVQGRMGRTAPMMASQPLIAAADAWAAQIAQNQANAGASGTGFQAQGGSYSGAFPTAGQPNAQGPQNAQGQQAAPPQGMQGAPQGLQSPPQGTQTPPLAPAAGSLGPRGTYVQSEAAIAAHAQNQASFGQSYGADPAQLGSANASGGGSYGIVDPSTGYGQQQQQEASVGGYPQAPEGPGYPKAPDPNANKVPDAGGIGRGLAVVFVLMAMFAGVGIGVALFRYL